MIELNQLEQLVSIAENKTISKASKELLISQPALSRSMQRLENDFGVLLFDHYKNKVELNENGKLAVEYAKRILEDVDNMVLNVKLHDQSFRSINIASCTPAPVWDIEPLIKNLYKDVDVYHDVLNINDLMDVLRSRKYSMVIAPFSVDDDDVICVPYLDEDLYLSLPNNHRLSTYEEVTFKDLENETLLLYSNIGFWYDMHIKDMPKTKFLLQSERSTFTEIVKASTLPSFTTNLSIKREGKMDNRIIIPFHEENAHISFYLIILKENQNKYKELLNVIENYYDY